jgi:hypothetical protein
VAGGAWNAPYPFKPKQGHRGVPHIAKQKLLALARHGRQAALPGQGFDGTVFSSQRYLVMLPF